MAEDNRIHTSKVLNNGYFSGNNIETNFSSTPIAVSPLFSDLYDYAMTEDIVLLNERKDTAEKLYKIYQEAPFAEKYKVKESNVIKIPKEDIIKVFYYTKELLLKLKSLSAFELVIAINEFYEFNYDHIFNKVLSPLMKSEILEDIYNNMGIKEKMDDNAADPLF